MGHADRGRSPLKPDLKFHIPGVLVDSAIGARAVDYDGRIGNMPRLQAREAAVACDLVLKHELENQVAVELQPLLDDHPSQTKTNGDAGLVVHGTAAEDDIRFGVDVAGEWRAGPFSRITLRLNVEMTVENKRAAGPTPPQSHDDVVAVRDGTDRLSGMRIAAEQRLVHRQQVRHEPQPGHILADAAHDGMLRFEATRNADPFLQQIGPVLPTRIDHDASVENRRVDLAGIRHAAVGPGAAIVTATHLAEPLEQRRTKDDYLLVEKGRLQQPVDATLAAAPFETKAPSPGEPITADVAATLPDRPQPNAF